MRGIVRLHLMAHQVFLYVSGVENKLEERSAIDLHLRGVPAYICSDNGPEFFAKAVRRCLGQHGLHHVAGSRLLVFHSNAYWEAHGITDIWRASMRICATNC